MGNLGTKSTFLAEGVALSIVVADGKMIVVVVMVVIVKDTDNSDSIDDFSSSGDSDYDDAVSGSNGSCSDSGSCDTFATTRCCHDQDNEKSRMFT